MIRIHLTPTDFARIRFASHPAPLQELNAALMMLAHPQHAPLLFGRWRIRTMRAIPAVAAPLRDLVPGGHVPAFLDRVEASLDEGFDAMRASDPAWIAAELELAYASTTATTAAIAPTWVRDLHRGGLHDAWQPVVRAERAMFDALLAPVWPLVQDLHRAQFTHYAALVAQHGIGHALTAAIPGSQLDDGMWQLSPTTPTTPTTDAATVGTATRDVYPAGRGLLLLPTFHWTGGPLISNVPDRPVTVTFSASPGLPLASTAGGTADEALADVLGRSRLRILTMSGDGRSTSGLAHVLGLSVATISAHTTALRAAGLIESVRDGKAVVHRRTALGSLLLGTPHDHD